MKFMSAWNVDGALEKPNGMTRNSKWSCEAPLVNQELKCDTILVPGG